MSSLMLEGLAGEGGKRDESRRGDGESMTAWRRRTGGVETVTDRIRANLQDFHQNRGGTQGTSDDTPKKQLNTLEKIEKHVDPANRTRNTAEVILD
jgi:hypothetical protein